MYEHKIPLTEEQEAFMQSLNPDMEALIDSVRTATTDAMLLHIAASDYGYEVDEYLQALETLRSLGWQDVKAIHGPREVLSLCHWDEPGNPGFDRTNPFPFLERHVIRLFCCSFLLAAEANDLEGYGFANNQTVIIAVDSAIELHSVEPEQQTKVRQQEPFDRLCNSVLQRTMQALSYSAIRLQTIDDEGWAFFLGILLCGIKLGTIDAAQADLICQWIRERTAQHIRQGGVILSASDGESDAHTKSNSPLNTTFFTIGHKVWRSLVPSVMQDATEIWRANGNKDEADRADAFVSWFVS
ncbi:MAG: hypothetical protein H6815_02420 [Phycisphaeraceae bacterium]|nr:hypothetical protein [Phycisphaerales bacterium]MCB9859282.1 hypothetical protein [Phycisphaeraceae bacterium]